MIQDDVPTQVAFLLYALYHYSSLSSLHRFRFDGGDTIIILMKLIIVASRLFSSS